MCGPLGFTRQLEQLFTCRRSALEKHKELEKVVYFRGDAHEEAPWAENCKRRQRG